MQRIQPIETYYRGVFYRSRLEARWAVFFDEINIKHNYEQRGIKIGKYSYLPDFRLPDAFAELYIEIKPRDIPQKEQARLDAIVNEFAIREKPDKPVFWVIRGYPQQGEYDLLTGSGFGVFACCDKCGKVYAKTVIMKAQYEFSFDGNNCACDRVTRNTHERLVCAFDKAVRYRFDHKKTVDNCAR